LAVHKPRAVQTALQLIEMSVDVADDAQPPSRHRRHRID
jgi:hypothetical protein